MPTLTDTPSYTVNGIYEIQATDPLEGAAAGASNGGIGVSNLQAQQLADRTAYLYNLATTNSTAITSLQKSIGAFTGLLATNGYLKIPYVDAATGAAVLILQWGWVDFGGPAAHGVYGPYQFAIPFPNLCVNVLVTTVNDSTGSDLVTVQYSSVSPQSFSVYVQQISTADSARGFFWFAIGN